MTVGIEQTIKAEICLIRTKVSEKPLEKFQIFYWENWATCEINQYFAQNPEIGNIA